MKTNKTNKRSEKWSRRISERIREGLGIIFIAIAGAMAVSAFRPVGFLSFVVIIVAGLVAAYLAYLTDKSKKASMPSRNKRII